MTKFRVACLLTLGMEMVASSLNAAPLELKTPIISHAGLFEPLVATRPITDEDEKEVSNALVEFDRRADATDYSSLTDFLGVHAHSPWAASIATNLGLAYLHDGYFSKAAAAWQSAWDEGKNATTPAARTMVDRAVGELARLDANLGHTPELKALFVSIGQRPISGSATEAIQSAREQLALVDKDPRHLFNCGPLALRSLLLAENASPDSLNFLQFYDAGKDGTSLAEIGGLADRAKLKHRLVYRLPGQSVPIPSVVHWKVGHFATILSMANGRYQVRDAVFPGTDIWVTQKALDEEASGYFLVPNSDPQSEQWTLVTLADAASIRGKGPTNGSRLGGSGDINANKNGGAPCPLCAYNIKEASVSLSLSDVPVGYLPPVGPSMKLGISYNQREDSQPANFPYFNVSPKWTLSWLSYVIDDPTNAGANVSRVQAEGGAFYYLGYNATHKTFSPQDDDGSILAIVSQSPIQYRRLLQDGTTEIYGQTDGSASYPRKIFLTKVIDPQGNAATLHYDAQFRLTSITDAVGRNTTFAYEASANPLLVTKITDPFGRSAALTYDGSGRLSSITDVIGLTSSFTYDANSLINSMTTPYGTTRFAYTAPGTSSPPRFVQVTDPMGFKEREEWLEPAPIPDSDPTSTVPVGMPIGVANSYLTYRNSFHWNKDQYVAAGCTDSGSCDYSKARVRHFVHMPGTSIKGTEIESEKEPLENRIWYNYPGQTTSIGALYGGTYDKPIAIGRVLDDGTTQLTQYAYDPNGYNLIQKIDPLGRTTSYGYSNNIDLSSVTQRGPSGSSFLLAQYIYNGAHRPVLSTDAAGRTTSYEYNITGQIIKSTDPLGEQITWQYDTNANLTSVTNANSAIAKSYTYDAYSRVRTLTDSEGWTLTYDYDAADRVTKVTYPDGTTTQYGYDRLDIAAYKDRENRVWHYTHDADRRITALTNPMLQQTFFGYNNQGQPTSLTDAKGYVTTLAYDLDGRQISKTFANGSAITSTYETTISRLKSERDPLGQSKQYTYANDNSLLAVSYANAVNATSGVSFTYDSSFKRLTSMTDGTGVTSYTYNPVFVDGALQRQAECFTATGDTTCTHEIDYSYDTLGRLHSRNIGGSGPESYTYDSIGRITEHSSDLGAFAISYLGQTTQKTAQQLLPAGSNLQTTWTYLDNAHDRRLASIGNTGLSTGQYSNFSFNISPENFISGITQTSDATISYPSASTQAASFNNLNQLATLNGQVITYDANGNLLTDGQRSYAWDAENRLIGISYPSQPGKATAFSYNGLSQRTSISSTSAGGGTATTTSYVWCGSQLCQSRDASNTPTRNYYAEGELTPGTSIQPYFYGRDQVGSVRRVFASTTSAPAYDFDPYGNALQSTAPATGYGYAGMVYNSDSGLYLTQFRAYDPVAGRWLSRDPAGEVGDRDGNLYSYVSGNPLGDIDPLGLCGNDLLDILDLISRHPWIGLLGLGTDLGLGGPENPLADLAALSAMGAAGALEASAGADEAAVAASTPIGRSGNPMNVPNVNTPGAVGNVNYSGHAFDEMQGDGIMPSVVDNAINSNAPIVGKVPGTTAYQDTTNNITVVTDAASGRVITVSRGIIRQ